MQKAIVHTATGVVRRLTIEENHVIAADESIIEVPDSFDLAGGYWKIDDKGKKTKATNKEVDDADVDDAKVAAKRKAKYEATRAIVTDLADNGVTNAKLQLYFQSIK